VVNNCILTGIPRSGTSLVCSLLNKLDNTLALVEPLDMSVFLRCENTEARKRFLDDYFKCTRKIFLATKQVRCLDFEGEGNTFVTNGSGARENLIKGYRDEFVTRSMGADFKLIIKHPNAFTALLGELIVFYPCFAVVRNPVSVIASWSTLVHPLRDGRAPMAEAFDLRLADKLSSLTDTLARQVCLVNWYFEIYARLLRPVNVIRYEDIISSQGGCLVRIVPEANCFSEALSSRNASQIYSKELMATVADKLLVVGGAWQGFYSDIELNSLVTIGANQ
jgi:hypothetical protein